MERSLDVLLPQGLRYFENSLRNDPSSYRSPFRCNATNANQPRRVGSQNVTSRNSRTAANAVDPARPIAV